MFLRHAGVVILRDPDEDGSAGGGVPTGSVTVPITQDPPERNFSLPEGVEFDSLIPEEYRDKPYLKDVLDKKDLKVVFDKLDGAQKLIGQRPGGIPKDDASQEEWDKFYQALGRPEKAEGYEFEIAEDQPRDESFINNVKGIFHKYGLDSKRAKGLFSDVDALVQAAVGQQNEDFEKLGKEVFGKDRDKVLESSRKLIEQYTPEKLKGAVSKLSNENLMIMAGVLQGVKKDYIGEDPTDTGGVSRGTVETVDELRSKARKLMSKPGYSNSFATDHKEIRSEVDGIYKRIGELQKQKS